MSKVPVENGDKTVLLNFKQTVPNKNLQNERFGKKTVVQKQTDIAEQMENVFCSRTLDKKQHFEEHQLCKKNKYLQMENHFCSQVIKLEIW